MTSGSVSPLGNRVHTRRASLIAASFDRLSCSPSVDRRHRNWPFLSVGSGGGSAGAADPAWETVVVALGRKKSGLRPRTNTAAMAATPNTSVASMAKLGTGLGVRGGVVVISIHREYFFTTPAVNLCRPWISWEVAESFPSVPFQQLQQVAPVPGLE